MQQAALRGLRQELDTIVPRVQQVIRQAKQRIFGGDTHVAEKLVSIFEPTTEIIRKGKASKPTEFGKMAKIQEGENQIVTDYAVYEKRPSDSELVIAALDAHEKKLGCTPRLVAGDAAFFSAKNEAAAHDRGVKRVCIPSRSTKSTDRKGEPDRIRDYPRQLFTMRPATKTLLKAIAEHQDRSEWKVVEDSIALFFERMAPKERRAVESLARKATRSGN